MDISIILAPVIKSLWYLAPLAILATVIKSPWFKGMVGEFLVNITAKLFLNKNEYHLVKNVTLPTTDGTTQIDHIIVSKYGIFVVETKNMKGWIFGNEKQKSWTQKIYRSSHKFQNPLHQNYKHVKTLEECLDMDKSSIFSLVVFVGDSTLKTQMPENVTKGGGYIRYIKSKTATLLSEVQVSEVLEKIKSGRLTPSIKTNIQHVKHVREIVRGKESSKDCPKCGGTMVLRETKKGVNQGKQFYGCSLFPKCRGIVAFVSGA